MKILVTGAGGFVGKWVVKAIRNTPGKAVIFKGNVMDRGTFPKNNFDVIIHLAALITHTHDYSYKELHDVNVIGTRNLLEAYPKSKMVYISTTDVARASLSDYGRTKLEAERLVPKKGNLIIRLPSVFGPGQKQKKMIPALFRKYCNNHKCHINNNSLREYAYVEDAAKYIINNLNETGIKTLKGFKIRNLDLDKMIRDVCSGEEIDDLGSEGRHFFECLKKCLPSYREKMIIVWDLDGTILDVKARHYAIYRNFLEKRNKKPLSMEEFWELKRAKIELGDLLEKSNCRDLAGYKSNFIEFIEQWDFLKMDQLQGNVLELLNLLQKGHVQYLVTLRRNRKTLIKQLKYLKIHKFFNKVLNAENIEEENFKSKVNAIKNAGLDKEKGILIGDTPIDAKCAKALGWVSVITSNGMADENLIKASEPAYFLKSLKEFSKVKEPAKN